MLIIDPETGEIIDANDAACNFYGYSKSELQNANINAINTLSPEEIMEEMKNAKIKNRNHFYFKHRISDGEIRDVEVFSGPINIRGDELLYSIIHDITEKLRIEREKDDLISKLENANHQINTLKGIIPICASCKKIRDDDGYWEQIEEYIRNHTEAEFSHGICPDCARDYYPDYIDKDK